MLVQWKYVFVFATFCTTQHVTSSILIDPVPEDISLSFSENNATNTDPSDIQPRKRDINTLNAGQSTALQATPSAETVLEAEEGPHFRSVRAIRPGFSRGRGGFGRGAFIRGWRGRYNPYWSGRYNPYWGGGYGYYYPYYYGGYYPLRPRRRPAIIIG